MRARMASWQERWPRIRDVRGLGSMLAIELDHAATASRVVEEALRRGLLLLKAGVDGRAIRVLVPLVVTDAELDEALAAWEQALEQAL
jgi:4-aminobutyrate aminotransferase-like enzyme